MKDEKRKESNDENHTSTNKIMKPFTTFLRFLHECLCSLTDRQTDKILTD